MTILGLSRLPFYPQMILFGEMAYQKKPHMMISVNLYFALQVDISKQFSLCTGRAMLNLHFKRLPTWSSLWPFWYSKDLGVNLREILMATTIHNKSRSLLNPVIPMVIWKQLIVLMVASTASNSSTTLGINFYKFYHWPSTDQWLWCDVGSGRIYNYGPFYFEF